MKNIKFLIACIVLFVGFSEIKAQSVDSKTIVKEDANSPEIFFEKTVHNFGSLIKNSDGSTEFVFINTGKCPLILSNVTASCDCTTPQWPKEPVMPGKTAKIKVVYDTKKIGVFSKTITVSSNAITNKVELTIQGEVYEN